MRRCCLILTVLAAGPAHAAGYYYSDSGVIATSRGGAWVAGADGQFAQHYNPAGLIRVQDPTVSIGWSGVAQNIRFDRMDAAGEFFEPAHNLAPPYSVPQLGFVTPIGDKFAFAFGFYSPYAPTSVYDENGPQRYSVIDTTIWKFTIGPSIAYQPVKQLTLGLGLGWDVVRLEERVTVTTSGPNPDGTDRPTGDVRVDARVWDRFTPNFNAGVLIDPIEQLSIGVSFQPPLSYKARGTGELDFTGNALEGSLDQAVWTDDDVLLAIQLPLVIRAGIAVRPVDGLEIEVAGDYERWKVLEDIVVSEVDVTLTAGSLEIPVSDEFRLPAGLTDTWSLRLGGEYRLIPELEVRLGGFYERSALSEQDVSVALVDTNKVQVGGGGSGWLLDERLRIDASFAWIFFDKLEIRDSTVKQINALNDNGPAAIVGNGDLRSHGWILGLQAAWAFKPRKKEG